MAWRSASLQISKSALLEAALVPADVATTATPALDDEGLTEEERDGGGPYDVLVYGMTSSAVVRGERVLYCPGRSLLSALGLSGTVAELTAGWGDALAVPATSVPGHSVLLTKVGLLKLIAMGTSAKALDVLSHVADGLPQYRAAEKVVRLAEAARRQDLRAKKELRKQQEEAELADWNSHRRAKQLNRKNNRKALASSGGASPVPEKEPGASIFRKFVREGTEQRLQLMVSSRVALEALRAKRAEERAQKLPVVPAADSAFVAEPEESKPDESRSYIELDPTRVKNIPAPTPVLLTVDQVYSGKGGTPAMSLLTRHFMREGRLAPQAARRLLTDCAAILKEEPNCIELQAPCHVFGDVHGQFYDLLQLIVKAGHPLETRQLWLGDYVDRGSFGCEVFLLLAAAKVKWPKHVYLLRGNHESRSMAGRYNFQREALSKVRLCSVCEGEVVLRAFCQYGQALEDFMLCFDSLPLAATITSGHGRYFCVHGGLSPMIRTPSDVERLERFEEVPHWGPTCDLLWSDPMEESEKNREEYYADNVDRGCGQLFGPAAVKDFLDDNEMVCIIRAHEVQKEGWRAYRYFQEGRPVPMVLTIFSAPNYCGTYENWGAFVTIADVKVPTMPSVAQISWADQPYALPGGGNVFTTFMPLVAESILGVFLAVLEVLQDDDETATEIPEEMLRQSTTLMTPEEEAAAQAKFDKGVDRLARKVASLRVERKEILSHLAPMVSADSSDKVFELASETDRRTELRRV